MTYAEFLKSQGATAEEITVLDTTVGRRAFEKMQTDAAAAIAAGETAAAAAKADREKLNKWFNDTAVPEFKEMERRAIASESETAKARAAWKAAQDRGLIDVAISHDLGYDVDAPPPAPKDTPLDTSKYVTRDNLVETLKPSMENVGESLATLQDIVMEHAQLFPDRPLRVRDLRRDAVAAGKTVEQFWTEKYGVTAAREKRDTDTKAAYEKRLRDEGAAEARKELASQYSNPDARPLVPSNSPFTKRPATGRDKQPWERMDDASNDRVARATAKLIERSSGVTH